jgi:hypothetical protein
MTKPPAVVTHVSPEAVKPRQHRGVFPELKLDDPTLAAFTALQALLTALGATNGGLTAVLLNEKWVLGVGLGTLVFGYVMSYLGNAGKTGPQTKTRALGLGLLLVGVGFTAYAAIGAPSIGSDPAISASVSETSGVLNLTATVSASGIPRSDTLGVEVLKVNVNAKNVLVDAGLLYHGELGADASGNASTTIGLPLPAPQMTSPYRYVDVVAGVGVQRNLCGFPLGKNGRELTASQANQLSRARNKGQGCALVAVPSP